MILKHWPKLFVLALIASVIVYVSCDEDSLSPIDDNVGGTLQVKHISPSEAPVIGNNEGGFDIIWSQSDTFYVIVEGPQNQLDIVRLIALTDSTYLYLMAIWNDDTRDVRPDHVEWIDKTGGHVRTGGQDFFYAIISDDNNGDVGADCYQMCHQSIADIIDDDTTYVDSMRNFGPAMVDSWLWMSGQTDPIGMGPAVNPPVPGTVDDLSFPGGGLPVRDQSQQLPAVWDLNAGVQDTTLPRYMHPDSNHYMGDFLYNSVKVDFDIGITHIDTTITPIVENDSIVGYDTTITPDRPGWPFGAEVPGYILADSVWHHEDESRFEIYAKGKFVEDERRWYLELRRRLDTGFPDDIQFAIDEMYHMSIGVTDSPVKNSPFPHYGSEPFKMQF